MNIIKRLKQFLFGKRLDKYIGTTYTNLMDETVMKIRILNEEMDKDYKQRYREYEKHLAELFQAREKFYRDNPNGPPNMFMNVIAPPQRCSLIKIKP